MNHCPVFDSLDLLSKSAINIDTWVVVKGTPKSKISHVSFRDNRRSFIFKGPFHAKNLVYYQEIRMTAQLVPTVRTSYTQQQMIEGFIRGWVQQFGYIPSKASIGVLYAQDALETGSTT